MSRMAEGSEKVVAVVKYSDLNHKPNPKAI